MHVWCMYLWPSTLYPDACMCDAYIYYLWSWHMCVWCMYLWCDIFVIHGQTLTLMHIYIMHVCMMHIHMLLDHYAYVLDAFTYASWLLCICINVWCIHLWSLILDYASCVYDAAEILSRTDGRTNKVILGVGFNKLKFILLSIGNWSGSGQMNLSLGNQHTKTAQYISRGHFVYSFSLSIGRKPVNQFSLFIISPNLARDR